MKHIVFFAFSFAMGLTCLSDNGGVLIFSDDSFRRTAFSAILTLRIHVTFTA